MVSTGEEMSRRTTVVAWLCRLGALAACAAMIGTAAADAVSDFFTGKTVSLTVGFPPGGGYDTYIRLLARHYGGYVPGHPSMVPANMPGAGSLVAASYLYAKAPPDGTVLAMFAASAALEPLFGNKSAQFDPARFGWIGSMSQQVTYCGVWQSPGAARSFDDMLTQETIFGGGSAAAITFQHPTILKNVLGAKIRLIPGYPGSREINLAMHRGEVNGVCALDASSIKSQFSDDVTSGRLKLVIQMGARRSAEFGAVPRVLDYAKTDAQRAVLEVLFSQLLLGRPLAAPPGMPPERLAALRAAFDATMKDANLRAEADKLGLDIDPASAAEVDELLKRYAAYPAEVFRQAQQAIGR